MDNDICFERMAAFLQGMLEKYGEDVMREIMEEESGGKSGE
ncbi:hypothetical protein AALA98_17815 [Lachnospiraceae bacterium 45-W7]